MNTPTYLLPLVASFKSNANTDVAIQMEKYMRNLFPFFGIKSPLRTDIYRDFKKENGIIPNINKSEIIQWCWQAPQREYQYFAMEFLRKSSKKEPKQIIELYEFMIITKSWWDTIDFIANNLLGTYFTNYPEEIISTTNRWMKSDNIWLQRSCLLFQLKY
ncbi:MAG: DNA alkylation repair protein, partial [Bacteroidota bacterium]